MSGEIIDTEVKVIDRRNDYSMETAQGHTLQVNDNSPAGIMQIALNKGIDISRIEKMLELQEKWEEREAKKAYFIARAEFNKCPLKIIKDKENSQFSKGDKKAMYTSLGNLLQTANPALGQHDLSASFDIKQDTGTIIVTCILSHKQGHSEAVTLSALPDSSGGNAKNPIQQIKSTITYLKGATFEAVTGLAVIDESNLDDDGNAAGKKKGIITEAQAAEIQKGIEAKNIPLDKYLPMIAKYCKLDQIADIASIPEKAFKEAIRVIGVAKGKPKTLPCPDREGHDRPISDCDKCINRKGCPEWPA
jgi:hypothetical protein